MFWPFLQLHSFVLLKLNLIEPCREYEPKITNHPPTEVRSRFPYHYTHSTELWKFISDGCSTVNADLGPNQHNDVLLVEMQEEVVLVIKHTFFCKPNVWETNGKNIFISVLKDFHELLAEIKVLPLFVLNSRDVCPQIISNSCEALTVEGIFDVRHPTGLCNAALLS